MVTYTILYILSSYTLLQTDFVAFPNYYICNFTFIQFNFRIITNICITRVTQIEICYLYISLMITKVSARINNFH